MTGSTVARPTARVSRVPDHVDALLVPLDGSGFSRVAVPVATHLAARLDAAIHLLSAVRTVEEVEARDRELAGVVIPGHVVHRAVVVEADPAEAIHEALRKLENGVVCMATHGRARSAALVGSVATEVVSQGQGPPDPGVPLREEGHGAPPGVVACVDDDPAAQALAGIALGWSGLLAERCTMLTVAEDVPEPVTGGPARRRFGPDGDIDEFLDRLAEPLRAAGHTVDATVRYDPVSVWGGLYRYLGDRPATLLVAGTRARTGLPRLVFGSEASSIVRHSESPVLVVPATAPERNDDGRGLHDRRLPELRTQEPGACGRHRHPGAALRRAAAMDGRRRRQHVHRGRRAAHVTGPGRPVGAVVRPVPGGQPRPRELVATTVAGRDEAGQGRRRPVPGARGRFGVRGVPH